MRIHRAARAMYPNGARERSKDCCMWSDAIPHRVEKRLSLL